MDMFYGAVFMTLGLILVVLFISRQRKKNNSGMAGLVKGKPLSGVINYNSENIQELKDHVSKENFDVIDRIIDDLYSYPAEMQELVRSVLTEPHVAGHYKALLADRDNKQRTVAAERLGKIGGQGTQEALFQAMADKNEEVRLAATEALKRVGDASIAYKLVNSLKDPNRWLPARVAEVLVSMGQSAVPALQSALDDDDAVFRGYVIEIIGEIGDSSSVLALHRALTDRESNIRLKAARALGEIGSSDSVIPLVQALDESEVKVVVQAVRSLGKIGGLEVIEHLTGMLGHRDSAVRYTVLDALRQMGPDGLKIIKDTAQAKGHPSAEKAKELINEIQGSSAANINIIYK